MQKKVYNLELKGGRPLQLEVKGSPSIEHDGSSTFHLVLLSKGQYGELKSHLEFLGVKVVHHFVEHEVPAKPQTERCLDCLFYVASSVSSCGIDIWTNDETSGYLRSKQAQLDLSRCPLRKTQYDSGTRN